MLFNTPQVSLAMHIEIMFFQMTVSIELHFLSGTLMSVNPEWAVTESSAEKPIKLYLRNASDRCGGRRKRQLSAGDKDTLIPHV